MSPAPSDLELEQFFAREGPRMRAYLTALVGATDAGDLVHETFMRAQRSRTASEVGAIGAWVRAIARNVAIDHLRRSAAAVIPGSGDVATAAGATCAATEPDPERSVIRQEMHDCIGEFVRRLPEHDAEVIVLSDMRGLPDQEIATALGITLGASKIRLHRARARLRAMMEHGCEPSHEADGLACDRKE